MRCPDLSPDELAIWFADQRINQRGIQVDLKAVDDCIAIVTQAYARYNAELYALTGWTVKAASEVAALKRWLEMHGCPMVDLDDEAVSAKLNALEQVPRDAEMDRVYRVLKIRSMLGSASIKKLFAFKLQASAKGRLHGLYQYFAARTGRWTGNGPQPQNFIDMRGGNIHISTPGNLTHDVSGTMSMRTTLLTVGLERSRAASCSECSSPTR